MPKAERIFFNKFVTKDLKGWEEKTKSAETKRMFEGYLTVEMVDKQNEITIVDELMKVLFEGMIAGSEIFRNQHERFAERSIPGGGSDSIPAIPALVERGRQTLVRFFDGLESYLEATDFVACDVFTMADITAFCAVEFVGWVDIKIPDQNGRTHAWFDRIAARPSAQA